MTAEHQYDSGPVSSDASEEPDDPVTASGLLRQALVDDQDPRFPLWLLLPGIAAVLGWAAYEAIAGGGSFAPTLLWPGVAIFAGTTLAAWFGWQLEID